MYSADNSILDDLKIRIRLLFNEGVVKSDYKIVLIREESHQASHRADSVNCLSVTVICWLAGKHVFSFKGTVFSDKATGFLYFEAKNYKWEVVDD